jgi:hypothetical protein
LAPIRSEDSVRLDEARTPRGRLELPPFVRFDRFMAGWQWNQGEHVTTIGPTGSGKTVLNRQLLQRRDFVVVLGVKKRDPELYGAFERDGYELEHTFNPEPPPNEDRMRVLFVPRTDKHGTEGRTARARRFRQALNDIYDVGYWTVYADDIQYMADQLRLAPEFEELWMLGRSEGVSVVASSQEPIDIPLMAYGMATHLFLFRNNDLRRAQRMAELTGVNREVAQHTILQLPEHEFLYINKNTGAMIRSRVIRPPGA